MKYKQFCGTVSAQTFLSPTDQAVYTWTAHPRGSNIDFKWNAGKIVLRNVLKSFHLSYFVIRAQSYQLYKTFFALRK